MAKLTKARKILRGNLMASLLAAAVMPLASSAMPSTAELAKAEKIVSEVMSSDVAAYKAKAKPAAEVATAALDYADEAQSEAAKYLLLKGALQFQVRANDYDGAAATASRLRAEISDLPDQTLADILSAALRRVPRRQGGGLYALLDRLQGRVKIAKEVRELERQARANPADKASRTQLGARYAVLGNWKKAIKSFAAGDGKFAEMARWEQKYPETGITELTTGKVADFWWEAGGGDEARARAYRAHAAYWYRKAIENGSLPGLTKALAEKRIAEAEKDTDAAEAAPQGVTAPKVAAVKRDPSQPPPRTLRLGRGADIEFVGCPAGSFMMGMKGDDNPRSVYRYHKVNITRPFWLSKYKVTHGMWNAYQKVTLTKEDHALGGMRRVHCANTRNRNREADMFCAWLTKRCRSNLPKDYVVRLPTEAEWEYALKANVTDPTDPYVRICDLKNNVYRYYDATLQLAFPEVKDCLVVWPLDVKPRLQAAGLWTTQNEEDQSRIVVTSSGSKIRGKIFYDTLGTEVGTKKPNSWGLFDMLGNRGELVLDTVSCVWHNGGDQDALCYAEEETDPLRMAEGPTLYFWRGGSGAHGWWVPSPFAASPCYDGEYPFRLCIGPDLMKEKGLKK